MYTFSMPDIPATKKQCMSCTESKRPNSIYSWWIKNPIESYSGEKNTYITHNIYHKNKKKNKILTLKKKQKNKL
jgi:hypothetical protein